MVQRAGVIISWQQEQKKNQKKRNFKGVEAPFLPGREGSRGGVGSLDPASPHAKREGGGGTGELPATGRRRPTAPPPWLSPEPEPQRERVAKEGSQGSRPRDPDPTQPPPARPAFPDAGNLATNGLLLLGTQGYAECSKHMRLYGWLNIDSGISRNKGTPPSCLVLPLSQRRGFSPFTIFFLFPFFLAIN